MCLCIWGDIVRIIVRDVVIVNVGCESGGGSGCGSGSGFWYIIGVVGITGSLRVKGKRRKVAAIW